MTMRMSTGDFGEPWVYDRKTAAVYGLDALGEKSVLFEVGDGEFDMDVVFNRVVQSVNVLAGLDPVRVKEALKVAAFFLLAKEEWDAEVLAILGRVPETRVPSRALREALEAVGMVQPKVARP